MLTLGDADRVRIGDEMRSDPEFMAGVREGVEAAKEGRFRSWDTIKRELHIGQEQYWPPLRFWLGIVVISAASGVASALLVGLIWRVVP
jgi:hypothetical protein